MDLSILGWPSLGLGSEVNTHSIARILAIHRSHMRAAAEKHELNLYLSGQTDTSPAVGDWVLMTPEFVDEQGEPAAIVKEILPRKSFLARSTHSGPQVLASNIDTVFVVTSANQDFNRNRLERFLILIREGGAHPVVVVSKMDLANEIDLSELSGQIPADVIGTSLVDNVGIDRLRSMMPVGSTSVFVGSSGVGKSSLVNRLLDSELQAIQGIREDDGKGRHTTTARQLFFIPQHGMIIDTPGIREVPIFGDESNFHATFPRVTELAAQCRFSDCQHESEPGCAILEALESGSLEEREWQNFVKLKREAAFARRKQDKAEMSNSKKRWRNINVMMRKKKKIEKS